MNIGKLVLAAIILLAIGVVILPSTVSLFAGQHNWYNVSPTGNQIPCQKCHADIYEELNTTGNPHKSYWGSSNADEEDCRGCHQANTSIAYASGENEGRSSSNPWQAHAASTITCGYCHLSPGYSGAPLAGGFGKSIDTTNDTGTYAAHLDFVNAAANNGNIFDAEDEACIACHTHVAVKINFTHYRVLKFNVTVKQPTAGGFNVTGFSINTSEKIYSTIWGNSSGTGWSQSTQPTNWP